MTMRTTYLREGRRKRDGHRWRANLTKKNVIWHLKAKPQTSGMTAFSSHLGANSILEADARHDIGIRCATENFSFGFEGRIFNHIFIRSIWK